MHVCLYVCLYEYMYVHVFVCVYVGDSLLIVANKDMSREDLGILVQRLDGYAELLLERGGSRTMAPREWALSRVLAI